MNNDMGLLSPASTWLFEETTGTKWTPEENKRFENALALFDRDTPDRWHNVASMIPGKTVSDVIRQYRELVEDVTDIEAGLIPIPGYSGNSFALELVSGHGHDGLRSFYGPSGKRVPASRCVDQERKKGVPWTEEEHRQFLLGLKKYGKGDWRNIARNFVTTRTPTQVASHAQKYFIRQLSGGKDKRRSSIHDITTVNLDEITSPSPKNNRAHLPENQNRILQAQHSVDGDALIGSNYSPTSGSLVMTQFQGNLVGRYSGLDQHESSHLQSIDRISWLGGHGTAFQMHRR